MSGRANIETMTSDEFRRAICDCLRGRFEGGLPWDQNTGTAFAVDLTLRLAPARPNPVLYGRPRSGSRALLEEWQIAYVPGEMFVDFVVGDLPAPSDLRLLIGTESEMHENHGVGHALDEDNGYVRDFRQLLRFPAPRLLFAARVRTERMGVLESSLQHCAAELRADWNGKQLLLILLPSASKRRDLVRMGMGEPDGNVWFEALDPAAS